MYFLFLLGLTAPVSAVAQIGADGAVPPAVGNVVSTVSSPAEPATSVIPALTPVRIRFEVDLGSKISTTGQMFPITLAEPIMLAGKVVVPAGVPGEGEVIHAKKAGGSGTSGELVLAVRYLDVSGRRLRLRSLQANAAGHDAIHGAAIASAIATPIGFFMTGTQTNYLKGWIAAAKTAEAFVLDEVANGSPDQGQPSH